MKHHVGNFIKQKLDEMGTSYSSIAAKVNKSRSTISHLLQSQTMYVDAVYDISIASGFNFFKLLSDSVEYELNPSNVSEPQPDYIKFDFQKKFEALTQQCAETQKDRDRLQSIADDRAHIIELLQEKIKALEAKQK